jgi:hypothetical protein
LKILILVSFRIDVDTRTIYIKQETQLVHAVHYENINYLIFPVMLSDVIFLPFYNDLNAAQ